MYFTMILLRPDQINLLLLGFAGPIFALVYQGLALVCPGHDHTIGDK